MQIAKLQAEITCKLYFLLKLSAVHDEGSQ